MTTVLGVRCTKGTLPTELALSQQHTVDRMSDVHPTAVTDNDPVGIIAGKKDIGLVHRHCVPRPSPGLGPIVPGRSTTATSDRWSIKIRLFDKQDPMVENRTNYSDKSGSDTDKQEYFDVVV